MGDSLSYLENLLVKHNVYSRVASNRLWNFHFRNFTIPLCNFQLLVFCFFFSVNHPLSSTVNSKAVL